MIFEGLPTTPTSEELIDTAFSRASRAGRAKRGLDAQQSMVQTAGNVVSDNLEHVVTGWPDFEREVDPFYVELAAAVLAAADAFDHEPRERIGASEGPGADATADATDPESDDGPRAADAEPTAVDALRGHLSRIGWASRKTDEIRREYAGRLRKTDVETARKHRKQAFARLADVVEQVEADLEAVIAARNALRDLPEIDPDVPTIVVAGYPNVGKSAFVNRATNARGETASYPFTTTGIGVGHLDRDRIRYQLVDTPGLLDRPPEARNAIESQAASAIEHVADCVLVLVDPTGASGYPFSEQLELRDRLVEQFEPIDVPVVSVANKVDRLDDARSVGESIADDVDHAMSVETGENVEAVLDVAIEAVDHEPTLPHER